MTSWCFQGVPEGVFFHPLVHREQVFKKKQKWVVLNFGLHKEFSLKSAYYLKNFAHGNKSMVCLWDSSEYLETSPNSSRRGSFEK